MRRKSYVKPLFNLVPMGIGPIACLSVDKDKCEDEVLSQQEEDTDFWDNP